MMTQQKTPKKRVQIFLVDLLFDIVGSFMLALGIHVFTASNQIAPGGVSGIAIIVNYMTGIPLGALSLLINIPLLLLGLKLLGKVFTVKTFQSVLVLSVMLDYGIIYIPAYQGDKILAALFGGVCMGAGLAIVFTRGSTTGGVDIASRIIQLRFPHMSIGRLLFFLDFVVLVVSALVFRSIETLLYGMITIFCSQKVMDSILYGLDAGRMVLVISDRVEVIAKRIIEELDRGVTFLHGEGGFSGEPKRVILCAVRAQQFPQVEDIVHQEDPDAFLINAEVGEIKGDGFRAIKSGNK